MEAVSAAAPTESDQPLDTIDGKTGWWAPSADISNTYDGVIWRTDDAGHTWKLQYSSQHQVLGIDFIDNSIGWAVLNPIAGIPGSGEMIGTTNGGNVWTVLSEPPRELISVDLVSASDGFGVTSAGDVVATTDGGQSWEMRQPNVSSGNWEAVCFSSPTTGWVAGGTAVAATTDGGLNWAVSNVYYGPGSPYRGDNIWCAGDTVWVEVSLLSGGGNDNYALLASIDGGGSWHVVASGVGVRPASQLGSFGRFVGITLAGPSQATIVTECEMCAGPTHAAAAIHITATSDSGSTFSNQVVQIGPDAPMFVDLEGLAGAGGKTWLSFDAPTGTDGNAIPNPEIATGNNDGTSWAAATPVLSAASP
jgi:hypothetical protein